MFLDFALPFLYKKDIPNHRYPPRKPNRTDTLKERNQKVRLYLYKDAYH